MKWSFQSKELSFEQVISARYVGRWKQRNFKPNKKKNNQTNKQIKTTTTATKLNKNKKQEQTKDKGKKRLKVVVQCKFETSYG